MVQESAKTIHKIKKVILNYMNPALSLLLIRRKKGTNAPQKT